MDSRLLMTMNYLKYERPGVYEYKNPLIEEICRTYGVHPTNAATCPLPGFIVRGSDVSLAQAAEAIRRIDSCFSLVASDVPEILTCTDPDARVKPADAFLRGLMDLTCQPTNRDGRPKWRGAWGFLHTYNMMTDYICTAAKQRRSGWITPRGKVAGFWYSHYPFPNVQELSIDAIRIAQAFPWLTCELSMFYYEETAPDMDERIVASINIANGEATCAAPVRGQEYIDESRWLASQAQEPYLIKTADWIRDTKPCLASDMPRKPAMCQWSLDELSDLWRDALDAV